jgi:hypothetical protein
MAITFKNIIVEYDETNGCSIQVEGAKSLRDIVALTTRLVDALSDGQDQEDRIPQAAPAVAVNVHVEAAKAEPPKETAAASTTLAPSASPASQTPPAPASRSDAPTEDYKVFANFTKLSEVVGEVRARGNDDYVKILGYCKRLADLGDICPPIDVLAGQGKLEERLRVHLAGKGVPGVPI